MIYGVSDNIYYYDHEQCQRICRTFSTLPSQNGRGVQFSSRLVFWTLGENENCPVTAQIIMCTIYVTTQIICTLYVTAQIIFIQGQ